MCAFFVVVFAVYFFYLFSLLLLFCVACIVQHLTFSPFYCRSRSESDLLLLLLLRPLFIYLLYSYYALSEISCCCSVSRCVAALWGGVITSCERFTSTAIVLSMHSTTQHIRIIFIFLGWIRSLFSQIWQSCRYQQKTLWKSCPFFKLSFIYFLNVVFSSHKKKNMRQRFKQEHRRFEIPGFKNTWKWQMWSLPMLRWFTVPWLG